MFRRVDFTQTDFQERFQYHNHLQLKSHNQNDCLKQHDILFRQSCQDKYYSFDKYNVFKAYYESDIFGFQDIDAKKALDMAGDTPEDEMPVKPFSVQWLMDTLARKSIGNRIKSNHAFLDQVQWGGNEIGGVRVRLTPNITIFIERKIVDLEGTNTWILKNVFKPKLKEYAGKEEFVAADVFKSVEKIYFDKLEVAAERYEVLNLAKRLSSRVRAHAPDLYIFQDIKEVRKDYYIVYFNLRGMGVGKLASRTRNVTQTPEATIDVHFDKKRGVIHIIVSTVSIGQDGGDWEIDIPYLDAFYAPTQPKDDIIDTVLTALKYF